MTSRHDFKGKRIAITGRFANTKEGFAKELEEFGAIPTKSVSSKTDYLIMGTHTGGEFHARARKLGVPVMFEAEARAVMRGEEVEVAVPGEAGEFGLDELLGEARSILAQPASLEVWRALLGLFDQCAIAHHGALAEYIHAHTSKWSEASMRGQYGRALTEDDLNPRLGFGERARMNIEVVSRNELYRDELRIAPQRWSAELIQGVDSPKFRLIHALELGTNSKNLCVALQNTNLTHVSRLNLRPNPKPTTQLARVFCQLDWLPGLTHLGLATMTHEVAEYLAAHTESMALETLDLSTLRIRVSHSFRQANEALARIPLFKTVKTLHISGASFNTPEFAEMCVTHLTMPELHTVALRHLTRWNATHLRTLRETGLLDGVKTLRLNDATISTQTVPMWSEIFGQTLPESIDTLDMSHIRFSPSSEPTEFIEGLCAIMAQGAMLEHITHLHLAESAEAEHIKHLFDTLRPGVTVSV